LFELLNTYSFFRHFELFIQTKETNNIVQDTNKKKNFFVATRKHFSTKLLFLFFVFVFAQSADGELLLWSVGEEGVGLVDGLAHLRPKMMEMYGEKVRLVPYGQKRGLLSRLGMAATDGLMQGIEERALWARFGL
jgi:hypothetical protein